MAHEASMAQEHAATYPPLDTLKSVADDVWIVDGPLVRLGPPLLNFAMPTRMTIVRLAGGDLFIHSPTPLRPVLAGQIAAIGRPRFIIAPNRLHVRWVEAWHDAYPDAQVFLAPRVQREGAPGLAAANMIDRAVDLPWDGEIATFLFLGWFLTEAVFFHRPSRTLILSDLIANLEPDKLGLVQRQVARLARVLDPHGEMPSVLRFNYPKLRLRGGIEALIALDPARIILAHGRWYDKDGAAELQRAFAWLLNLPVEAPQTGARLS